MRHSYAAAWRHAGTLHLQTHHASHYTCILKRTPRTREWVSTLFLTSTHNLKVKGARRGSSPPPGGPPPRRRVPVLSPLAVVLQLRHAREAQLACLAVPVLLAGLLRFEGERMLFPAQRDSLSGALARSSALALARPLLLAPNPRGGHVLARGRQLLGACVRMGHIAVRAELLHLPLQSRNLLVQLAYCALAHVDLCWRRNLRRFEQQLFRRRFEARADQSCSPAIRAAAPAHTRHEAA
eukprot:scaffold1033_cov135-Isochrysis_galbana.AAC.1